MKATEDTWYSQSVTQRSKTGCPHPYKLKRDGRSSLACEAQSGADGVAARACSPSNVGHTVLTLKQSTHN